MKQLILLLISISLLSGAFAQEEIWGLNSLMGAKGGGLVYQLDLEAKTAQTIHSFGYSLEDGGMLLSPLCDDESGNIFGITDLNNFNLSNAHLFKFNTHTQSFEILTSLPRSDYRIGHINEEYVYFFRNAASGINTVSYILKYDRIHQLFSDELYINKAKGGGLSGKWKEKDNKLYFLANQSGINNNGSFLEYHPDLDTVIKRFDFEGIYRPIGSLQTGANGEWYGVCNRGGDSDGGAIFRVNENLNGYQINKHFIEQTGGHPVNQMTKVSDQDFYGMTSDDGLYGNGTIYQFNPQANSLQAVYSFDNSFPFDTPGDRSTELIFDGNQKLFFYYTTKNSETYLLSFHLDEEQLQIEIDFDTVSFQGPVRNLLNADGKIFSCLYQSEHLPRYHLLSSFDSENKILKEEKALYIHHIEEEGQAPFWMGQSGDGNIYGFTFEGGKDNNGIAFKIDYYTREFTKLFDLADQNISFNNYFRPSDAFLFDHDHLVGFRYKGDIFDFNTSDLSIEKLFILPDTLKNPNADYRKSSNGKVYFQAKNAMWEFDYSDKSLEKVTLPNDMPINDIFEWKPGIYFASTDLDLGNGAHSIVKWNRNTNEVDLILGGNRFRGLFGLDHLSSLHVTKNEKIIATYSQQFTGDPLYQSFLYDMALDSIIVDDAFMLDYNVYFYLLNNNRMHSLLETDSSDYVVSSFLVADEEIELFNTETLQSDLISLEESVFDFIFWSESLDVYIEDNAPFDLRWAVNTIKVRNPKTRNYWLGRVDSLWFRPENWANKSIPLENEDIYISKRADYFPYIDTSLYLADLYLEEGAELRIAAYGTVSCRKLSNLGILKMEGNPTERGSLIFEELEEKGLLQYQYQTKENERKILALPVESYLVEDSLLVWRYGNEQWLEVNENTSLSYIKTYQFELDTTRNLKFKGQLNSESLKYIFAETALQPIPNPFTASIDFSQPDWSQLSEQAIYTYNAEDSSFFSYVDALGDFPPLMKPLDVFWVNTKKQESVELNIDQLIHAEDFEQEIKENQLVIAATGSGHTDFTHISFNENASRSFDAAFDAKKIPGFKKDRAYVFTWADSTQLSIQQLPDTSMLEMGVIVGSNGNYRISIAENKGFDFVVLEDLILNTKTDLLKQDYTFSYFTTDGHYPFRLYFKDWAIKPLEEVDVEIYYYPESIVVQSRKQIDQAEIRFFDMAGRKVQTYKAQNFTRFEKPISLSAGHYVVQLRTSDLVMNKKILVR